MEMDEGSLPGWVLCRHAVPNICRPWVLCKCQKRHVYANYRCRRSRKASHYLPPRYFSSSSISRSAIASIALSSTSGSSSVGGGRVLSARANQYHQLSEILEQTYQALSNRSSSHSANRYGMSNEDQEQCRRT